MTWERVFIRAQVAVVAVVVLTGMVWGPKALVNAVLGATAPLPGEIVPRQIPYRGYLEQNGAPVNDPGVPMRFRLFGIDGGVLHEESRAAVPIQNGQFSVELGDSTPLSASVTQQNFLELEIAVGSTPVVLAGRQRLLSVPYAARALDAWRAGNAVNATNAINAATSKRVVLDGDAGVRTSVDGLYCGAVVGTNGRITAQGALWLGSGRRSSSASNNVAPPVPTCAKGAKP